MSVSLLRIHSSEHSEDRTLSFKHSLGDVSPLLTIAQWLEQSPRMWASGINSPPLPEVVFKPSSTTLLDKHPEHQATGYCSEETLLPHLVRVSC